MTVIRTVRRAALLALLAALTACSATDQSIRLAYAPLDHSFGRHSGEIVVSRQETPAPQRTATGEYLVGAFNNVHGVPQADIRAAVTPGEWMAEALTLELKQAGYSATLAPQPPATAPRAVVLTNIRCYLNVNSGLVTDEARQELRFEVDLLRNGSRIKSFSIASRDTKTVPFSISRQELEQMLLQSLQDAMHQIVPAVIAELERP